MPVFEQTLLTTAKHQRVLPKQLRLSAIRKMTDGNFHDQFHRYKITLMIKNFLLAITLPLRTHYIGQTHL
jgi:hypothetical protein